MNNTFIALLISLVAGVGLIVLLTARYRMHAFFALFAASFFVGICVQMPVPAILTAMKDGFGHIMKSLGFIIVLGTTLGVLLEYTGSTQVMARFILKRVGERYAAAAMSITGFIVGMPIFCDSGYIVLSGLSKSLSARTGIATAIMSASLATGLYAVHCLIPPHPGAAAAAGLLQVDFGRLILVGTLVAIPAAVVGSWWAHFAGRKFEHVPSVAAEDTIAAGHRQEPTVWQAFLPVIIPILLIAAGAAFGKDTSTAATVCRIMGDPILALTTGVVLAFWGNISWTKDVVGKLLQDGAEKAGGILVIIGAGGAFGAVLAATDIGKHFGDALPLGSLGIFFPFLLTFILKTAQGSSTVAIITAASIIHPLLPALGLQDDTGRMLCVLSMGAGSMMISHANDAYFWVIAKFSSQDMKPMLRVYSIATIWMGVVSFACIYLLSLLLR
ncbi:GntP family permease [Chitinophaga pendula]|uniref:GntP family permease n=1 Tax=Chitinophaga TaxID=79328 RepID=UPI000BB0C1CA|nr:MULTISPECIES: GntP family permease [Chitinophaga]ASZ09719.1 gluconate transporter [Chitinophaga sp. MD30]UCJ07337.1 GntP family permease [Chitinophaga pendula]